MQIRQKLPKTGGLCQQSVERHWMKYINFVDAWILGHIFWPISKFLGRRFGVTNGVTVRFLAILMVVLHFWGLSVDWLTDYVFNTFLAVMQLGIALFLYQWSTEADTWPNSNTENLFLARVLNIGMLSFDFVTWEKYLILQIGLFRLSFIAYSLAVFFASLPPAPPKKQKEPKLAGLALEGV